jgi:alpha-soluble NSF attachment protein
MASTTSAESYLTEANKALNRSTFFGIGKQQKFTDAAKSFTKAGNVFKLLNQWQSAGDVFLQAADALMQAGDNKNEVIEAIVEAGNCYKKINPVEAVKAFQNAINYYNEIGRFGSSARYWKEIAEIFEADNNTASAADAYEQAAQMFERDNKKSNANTCMLKVATFSSEKSEQLLKAAKIFEDIGKGSLSSRLGAFSAKGYFLQALLCHLALGDQVQVRNKLDEYKNLDYSFGSSREADFITKLIEVKTNEEPLLLSLIFINFVHFQRQWKLTMRTILLKPVLILIVSFHWIPGRLPCC